MVVFFWLVYATDAEVGPGKFHVTGTGTVRGIGAVQVLFRGPSEDDDADWREPAAGVRIAGA